MGLHTINGRKIGQLDWIGIIKSTRGLPMQDTSNKPHFCTFFSLSLAKARLEGKYIRTKCDGRKSHEVHFFDL